MKENKIGKVLFIIGVLTIIIGALGSFIIALMSIEFFFFVLIGGIASSFISGICFIGFSEIINLLQMNLYKQDIIVGSIKNQTLDNKVNSLKASLKDLT